MTFPAVQMVTVTLCLWDKNASTCEMLLFSFLRGEPGPQPSVLGGLEPCLAIWGQGSMVLETEPESLTCVLSPWTRHVASEGGRLVFPSHCWGGRFLLSGHTRSVGM